MKNWAVFFLCVSLTAGVKINEVMFRPDVASAEMMRNHAWVELWNNGEGEVDLSGWVISASDGAGGASARALPAVQLPAGAYLVVHFAEGENRLGFGDNSGDYYTGDAASGAYFRWESDEVALYSPDGIVDFFKWKTALSAFSPGAAYADAVAAKIWTEQAVMTHDQIGAERLEMLRSVEPGESIGRDAGGSDSDLVSDFDANGGVSGMGPTPGRRNLTAAGMETRVDGVQGAAQAFGRRAADAVKRKWTVILYMSSDNNLESYFFRKLYRLQENLPATEDVAFVTQWDAKTIAPSTYRFRVGTPRGDNVLTTIVPEGQNADIGERNMGDPAELREFLQWAVTNYPAENYGLILSGHGDGWKGYGPDESFAGGKRVPVDTLFMGELTTALAGQRYEWIAFDACLMAGVEVAHQLKDTARYLLASEEITYATDFPYEKMAAGLAGNPAVGGEELARFLFDEMSVRQTAQAPANWELSLVDLAQVPGLVTNVRAWADLLAPGMSLLQRRDDPNDNVQVLTASQVRGAEKFWDKNFIDLYHFTDLMRSSGVPSCLLSPTQSILDLISKRVVLKEGHGTSHPNAHGLHIYFPRYRMLANAVAPNLFPNFPEQPYDMPYSRTMDGSTPLAHFGVRMDALPLKERDPETGQDFEIGAWPLPQSPGFLFPNDTGWFKVLDRFYHPAADNKILRAIAPDGSTILPSTSGGGACANSSDSISAPVGSTVYFSGAGSSDADMPGDGSNVRPLYYFWDMDDKKNCDGCPQPQTVPPGSDAGLAASNNMDADRDLTDAPTDDKDASGVSPSRVCTVPGTVLVTLIPWDDNHLMPYHNTLPSAAYVHPQTGLHTSTVSCYSAPPPSTCTGGDFNTDFRITIDRAGHNPFIGLSAATWLLNVMISGTMVTVTGNQSAIARTTGTIDTATCTFNTQGLNTVAGFPGIDTKFKDVKISTSGNTRTISGTYVAGEDGKLPQGQSATYSISGTLK
ncbi:MAG: lamin tail domain-containing protein [Acidobacteria bacterium]|nr:lamin tail domain-containing protein [Acidobacteriota bacterium]